MMVRWFRFGGREAASPEKGASQTPAAVDADVAAAPEPANPVALPARLGAAPSHIVPKFGAGGGGRHDAAMNRASMFSVSRRSRWTPHEPPRKFMDNVQRASPELRFDLENKCKFAVSFRGEIEAYLGRMNRGAADVGSAIAFLNFCSALLHDYEHVLALDDYHQGKARLVGLSVSERRRVESFYSDFFVAVRGLQRVLLTAWPQESRSASIDPHIVEAALADALAQIECLNEALDDLLSA